MEINNTQAVLSERELEILKLVATGATNQQIAQNLVISPNTVKVHLRNIFGKLGVESRTEATMYAVRQGWVVLETPPAAAQHEATHLPPRQRIAPWQRALFVLTAVAIALMVLLPPARTASPSAGGSFTDRSSSAFDNPAGSSTSRWSSRAQMPTARARLAVVAYQGMVYAIGGDSDEGASGAVEVYDPLADAWTRRANKPRAVRNISAIVLGERIYVPGGYDATDQAIDNVEVYDPQTDAWSEVAPLPVPLFAYAAAAVQGKLYLFGGSDGLRYLDSAYVYDPSSDIWSTITPMDAACGFCAATVVGEQVYVIGGYDEQSESARCAVYTPAQEGSGQSPWTERASLHVGRGGLTALTVEGYVYAIGGGWAQYLSFNERYDVNQDKWVTFDSPLLGQWRTLGAAAIQTDEGPVIYVVGGWNGRNLSSNYAYKTFFRIYMPGM